jgi:hypothetical protein
MVGNRIRWGQLAYSIYRKSRDEFGVGIGLVHIEVAFENSLLEGIRPSLLG